MGLFDSIGGLIMGQQGNYYKPGDYYNPAQTALQEEAVQLGTDNKLNGALANYGQGSMSLNDLISGYGGTAAGAAGIATNPLSGTKFATEQVQNNPILSQLFGQNGSMQKAGQEEQQLASRGYSLQPEDYEAYGQASDQIARQFGQTQNSLASALASRGLAGGGGGAVGAQFSGLEGNKNEMLAQQQRGIAQQRMQMNLDRLNSTRQYLTNLGGQAANDINQQYNQNLSGINNRRGVEQQAANNYNTQYFGQEANAAKSIADQRAAFQPGLFQSAMQGINKGVSTSAADLINGSSGSSTNSNGSASDESTPQGKSAGGNSSTKSGGLFSMLA